MPSSDTLRNRMTWASAYAGARRADPTDERVESVPSSDRRTLSPTATINAAYDAPATWLARTRIAMTLAACHNGGSGSADAKIFRDASAGLDAPTGTGTATVSGTIAGQSYTIVEALSFADTSTDGGGFVLLATSPNACARIAADTVHPNEKFITISMSDTTSTGSIPPTAPGTYFVATTAQPKAASFDTEVFDATCTYDQDKSVDATSGSVSLSSISGANNDVYVATFDVTFSTTGDHVTGTFSTTPCSTPATVGMFPTCM